MRTKTLLKCGASVLMASSLASCGGGGSNGNDGPTSVTPTPPASTASIQSKLGATFAGIFDSSATGEPVDPTDASVPALAPTSEPVSDS